MSQTFTNHIRLDERGAAWIDDTNVKAIEVALDQIAHGLSPEEICDQHDITVDGSDSRELPSMFHG